MKYVIGIFAVASLCSTAVAGQAGRVAPVVVLEGPRTAIYNARFATAVGLEQQTASGVQKECVIPGFSRIILVERTNQSDDGSVDLFLMQNGAYSFEVRPLDGSSDGCSLPQCMIVKDGNKRKRFKLTDLYVDGLRYELTIKHENTRIATLEISADGVVKVSSRELNPPAKAMVCSTTPLTRSTADAR
ncbi:hypothetical protein FACS189449_01030 [Alphaproteobacteria bacterium]|nr:hypothetical protein FACS189449_01030 [Alphaproteobacteria bacterium]